MDYFKILPSEITVDILSRVPTESILECKSVCKTWNNLVSHHPSFSKMHLNHLNEAAAHSGKLDFLALTDVINANSIPNFHYFEYNENNESTTPIEKITRVNFSTPVTGVIRFLGSINGIICLAGLQSFEKQHICICNPITKEYVMLPEIETNTQCVCLMYAFGYVSSTNEYKFMRIMVTAKFVELHIYTLGSGNGWRILGKFPSEFNPHYWQQPILFNERVYWMGNQSGTILTFDLSEEKFFENISAPPLALYDIDWIYHKIGVLDGFLFFGVKLFDEKALCYDIWLLRKKNDNHDMKDQEDHQSLVWSKEFRVDGSELLAMTKSDGILSYLCFNLNLYDTKALTSKTLVEFEERFCRIYPHKNTLVSLKELGEEDTKIMESVKEIESGELVSS